MWFRRDLRLADHPALAAASESGDGKVAAVFVIDDALWGPAGRARRDYLVRSLRALDAAMDGRLWVLRGRPADVVPAVAQAIGASTVHVTGDFAPYGMRRDATTAAALERVGASLVTTGSPYAVEPGTIRKDDGTAYRVYTPFYRSWKAHGWAGPVDTPTPDWIAPPAGQTDLPWVHLDEVLASADTPDPMISASATTDSSTAVDGSAPPVGEAAAWAAWEAFRGPRLTDYADDRNRPDLPGTSRLSAHLRWGEIHPRSLLAELGSGRGDEVFEKELAWREFYADVLWHSPGSVHSSLDPRFDELMEYDSGDEAEQRFEAWCAGRTGYPFVDAGMRQLLREGWMHNRVRMVTASFLIKDLHLPWWRGAEWFMQHLVDGDVASNTHGWQWTAGCGTDAAPYYRVFNPVLQGLKFDPDGDYVRKYVPELAGIPGASVHEPWKVRGTLEAPELDYPEPIVDHHRERDVSLARFQVLKGA